MKTASLQASEAAMSSASHEDSALVDNHDFRTPVFTAGGGRHWQACAADGRRDDVAQTHMDGSRAATVARISWYDMVTAPTAAPVDGGVAGAAGRGVLDGRSTLACACSA